MFPTSEQSGHQYGAQLMYACLSPEGGTTVLFMTRGAFQMSAPDGVGREGQTHTPRSQSRVLICPLDDGLLSDHSVRRKLLSDDVIWIDEIVRVAYHGISGRGESS